MFPKVVFAAFTIVLSLLLYRRRRILPPAAVLLIVALFFSRIYWRVGGFTLRWESMACLVLALNFFFDLWKKRETLALEAKTGLVLALFPMMLVSSVLFSPDPRLSLKKSLIYIPFLLAFTALVHYFRRREKFIEAWDIFYVAGCLALSISTLGLILFLRGLDLGMVRAQEGTLWLRGTFVIPNILGSAAVLILMIAFLRLTTPEHLRGLRAWPHAAALVPATACVLTSMTRSAWICAASGIIIVTVYALVRRRPKAALAGLAVIAASAGLTYWVTTRMPVRLAPVLKGTTQGEFGEPWLDRYWKPSPELGHLRFSTKFVLGKGKVSTFSSRRRTAEAALEDWSLSPIIGRGTESLLIRYRQRPLFYISSTWVAVLHDWGLVGLGLHLAFLVLVLLGMGRVFGRAETLADRRLVLSLIIILVVSTIMNQASTTMQISVFWVLLAFFTAGSSPALIQGPPVMAPVPPKP